MPAGKDSPQSLLGRFCQMPPSQVPGLRYHNLGSRKNNPDGTTAGQAREQTLELD